MRVSIADVRELVSSAIDRISLSGRRLNNATDAPPLADYWGIWPWSPIVGVERSDAGIDWYRHEDGSYSTTEMVWRSDYKRFMAMTRVGHPTKVTAPTAPQASR